MKEKVFVVNASSPQNLQAKLAQKLDAGGLDHQFIYVFLNDPKVCVYPFHFPNAPQNELLAHIMDEAAQLLSLKPREIELNYQVFNAKNDQVEGVLICMPKKLLEHYIAICDAAGLIPIQFTAELLSGIGALYQKYKPANERFCILNFSGNNRLDLAVFFNQQCQFLRQTYFETPEEARADIIQSLRSACAKSQMKTIEHIYAGGAIAPYGHLISEVQKDSGAQATAQDTSHDALDVTDNYFNVNLLHNYSFALPRRRQFTLASNIVLGCLALFLAIGVLRLVSQQMKINHLRSSYKPDDVRYAQSLQKKLDSLPDAK
ncbi:MAG TPA: hypothetical protein VI749_06615 [Candidatus Omnitrophota bacterium]|nr:hypothetical protein [Candidatus Omnitrophota bacterium]